MQTRAIRPLVFTLSIMRCLLYMAFMTLAHASDGVILLHGLARSAGSMSELEARLADAGHVVVNVDYPSRTAGIEQLSEQVISSALADPRLRSCDRIHFVTHSLGGSVLIWTVLFLFGFLNCFFAGISEQQNALFWNRMTTPAFDAWN
jgi:hypothetical protein